MSKVTLEISDELRDAIRLPHQEHGARLKRELAIRLYHKGLMSFGKARELAEMSKWDFHVLLGDEAIERRYDVEELAEDLDTLEGLG